MAGNHVRAEPRKVYKWPWLVLTAVVLGIVLAVLWMSREVQRAKRIGDANSSVEIPVTNTRNGPR
jgi:hypothetical protein